MYLPCIHEQHMFYSTYHRRSKDRYKVNSLRDMTDASFLQATDKEILRHLKYILPSIFCLHDSQLCPQNETFTFQISS